MCQQRRTIRASLATLKSLGEIILDDSVEDPDLRERLFAAVPRAALATQLNDIRGWVAGNKSEVFREVVSRANHLRKFSPAFLDALQFVQESAADETPCLRAVQTLRELNTSHKRTLPEDAPTDFVAERLRPLMTKADGQIDKRAWECALLITLRDEIKAGNLSVRTASGSDDSTTSSSLRHAGPPRGRISFATPACPVSRAPSPTT